VGGVAAGAVGPARHRGDAVVGHAVAIVVEAVAGLGGGTLGLRAGELIGPGARHRAVAGVGRGALAGGVDAGVARCADARNVVGGAVAVVVLVVADLRRGADRAPAELGA